MDHVEELAERIAAGDAVAPEEVLAVLDRCRCSEDDLQNAVDRHSRVADLRKMITTAPPIEKRLGVIEAEVSAAEAEVRTARAKLADIVGRVNDEHLELRHKADAIDRARRALMYPENLPPGIAERLRAVRGAADIASETHAACERDLAERKSRLRLAEEEELPRAEAGLRARATADARENLQRWRNAVVARRDQVADAERSELVARRAAEAARSARDAAEAEAVAIVYGRDP